MSSTADGIVWKVIGASPRVLFTSRTGGIQTIPSLDISASGDVDRPGVITLAEKFDKNWHLLLDGTPIPVLDSAGWLTGWNVPFTAPVATTNQTLTVSLNVSGTLTYLTIDTARNTST